MKIVDISNEIWLENAEPDDTSIPAIAFWLRSNVGKLNNLIYENFSVDTTSLEIFDDSGNEITELAAAILKMMYKVYRTDLDIRNNIHSIRNDSVLSATDEGFSVKRINRSEVLKTLSTIKQENVKELASLVHNYRSYKGAPVQVAGDDTVIGHYAGITSQIVRSNVGG